MSVVTNTILSFKAGEDFEEDKITAVNTFFRGKGFVNADPDKDDGVGVRPGWYGGTKCLETPMYVGAFNGLDLECLVAHLRTIPWENPECVQLIVKEQEDEIFRIIGLLG